MIKPTVLALLAAAFLAAGIQLRGITQETAGAGQAMNQQILNHWSGDYPVSALGRLPKNQRKSAVGYIADAATFKSIWHAFMPGADVPKVDLSADLVVFSRNVHFYNSTSIAGVKLSGGVLDVIAIETMSSRPIEDKVGFAMAVISRDGVKSLKVGDKSLPVPPASSKPGQ